MEETEEDLARRRMKEFYQLTDILFTRPERLILYKILKDYRSDRDVVRLVVGLNLVLRTYTKLELLKYVRYMVWEGHLDEFDRLTGFHSKFRRRRQSPRAQLLVPGTADHRSIASASTSGSSHHIRDVRVFTVHRDPKEGNLGFSVRGGSEHGLGIYVSEIDSGSAAEKSGLQVGDKILEVNNIGLKGVASSSAVKVLTGSNRLKLVVQRTRKVPEWRLSREKTSWFDVQKKRIIKGEFEECGILHNIRGLDVDLPERRVSLKFEKTHRTLGFNVRGGKEYGVGIYISRVDRGGLAEKNGVHVGDQIIDVNGIPLDNITHAHAVEVLKGKKHLILTLRDVGRFPVFKELYAEYTWSDSHLKAASNTSSLRDIPLQDANSKVSNKSRSISNLFTNSQPSALQNEIFLPNARNGWGETKDDIGNIKEIADDSDSIIDLEQWGQDLRNEGIDNQAYISDEGSGVKVIVHKENVRHENVARDILQKLPAEEEDSDSEVENRIESEYDTPDMIYAKINKGDSRYASTSNLSVNSRSNKNVSLSDKKINTPPGKPKRKGVKRGSVLRKNQATENRLAFSEDELQSSTPVIEGALYSTVRRLSAGSFKNLASSNFSLYSSNQSLNEMSLHQPSTSYELVSETDSISKTYQTKSFSEDTLALPESDSEHGSGSYDLTIALSRRTNVPREDKPPADNQQNMEVDDEVALNAEELQERLKELEQRQTQIGMHELDELESYEHDTVTASGSIQKKGKWKTFKNKVKGSLRLKTPTNVAASRHVHKREKIDGFSIAQLDESARKLLNEDEFKAVNRHIKLYHESHDLDGLVEALLLILDKPEKLTLLKDVRGVIYKCDMVRFENLVNDYEIEAYQKLSMKLHLPLNHKPKQKPKRNLITTEIAEDGHFHIKTMDQTMKQKEVVDTLQRNIQYKKKKDSPHRQVKIAEEESALDHFEYLDFEHSDDGSNIAAFSDYGSPVLSGLERIPGSVVVHLSKTKKDIGIDFVEEIVNGVRELKVDRIDPKGAAHDDSIIEPGMTLLAVDRQKIEGLSLEEVLGIIETAYMDKQRVSMKLVFQQEESTNF